MSLELIFLVVKCGSCLISMQGSSLSVLCKSSLLLSYAVHSTANKIKDTMK